MSYPVPVTGLVVHLLTLLHSEKPKIYGVLAVLSAVGLNHLIAQSLLVHIQRLKCIDTDTLTVSSGYLKCQK